MATDAEYGSALRGLIEPLNCGVGPIEAAINAERALEQFKPDLVVSLGSAGSSKLEQAAIYQVSEVSYRDMDATAFGFAKGETPFSGLPVSLQLPYSIPDVARASLSTGANVVSGDAYQTIDADMVDMETFAIMRACMMRDLPLIGLRGISDGAEPVSDYSDWTRYLEVIDQRLAETVALLLQAVEDGSLIKS